MKKAKTTLDKWMPEMKTISFQHIYYKIHRYEMFRRRSRKNLLVLSLIYAGIIITLVAKIF